jgi:cyclopropane fatty-acyl-phospholipid synthase-like methyltransferase
MTQEFLDSKQYTELSILRYEAIFGHNYISPGGETVADEFINTLDLRQGMSVLDIGCGLGGPAFRMASKSGVHVHGIDLSSNMIRIAKTRLKEEELNNLVTFSQANCLELQTVEEYNVIHSRDVFLHISDKNRLFEVIRRILVSGGQLGFSDYCHGATKPGPEFKGYLRERNYSLLNVEDYTTLLKKAGFTNIIGKDKTLLFIKILENELNNLETAPLNKKDKSSMRKSWDEKLKRAQSREQGWAWFTASKD